MSVNGSCNAEIPPLGYDIVKVCLSIACPTPKAHLQDHDIVKACLTMAHTTLKAYLEGHDIAKSACQWFI